MRHLRGDYVMGESWHINRKEGTWNTGDELKVRLAHVKLIQEELKLTRDLRNLSRGNQLTCSVS